MRKNYRMTAFLLIVLVFTLSATSVNAQRNGASGKVIKTNIDVHYKSRIDVSDSLIAFGTGFLNGVSYLERGKQNASAVPDSTKYSSGFFAVIDSKIVLAKPDFTLTVFDASTKNSVDIPEAQVRLRSIGGDMFTGGSIQRGGKYAVVISDVDSGDGSAIKVIDVSSTEPRIVSFPQSGKVKGGRALVRQVAIDAKTGKIAVVSGREYKIRLFDISDPAGTPRTFDLTEFKGVGKAQMVFDDGKILFQSGESKSRAIILDTTSGKTTSMTRSAHHVAMANGRFVYFADRGANDYKGNVSRAVVGKIGAQPKLSTSKRPVGGSPNNGIYGFGATAAITPDGSRIFIAGWRDIGQTERFQTLIRSNFVPKRDSSSRPAFLQASDVVASSRIVAFKTGRGAKTKLGYINLK